MKKATAVLVLALTVPLPNCGRDRSATDSPGFGELVRNLSEQGGFFDTDNLISNESSYLHVMESLERPELRGGAYIGVGPDQNFSYIAGLRPEVAYILDIRRDNMLEHLLFKALFHLSADRIEYLGGLLGRMPDAARHDQDELSPEELLGFVESGDQDDRIVDGIRHRIDSVIATFGIDMSEDDWDTVDRFHRTFMAAGMDLQFNSYGRAPQSYYPTYRQLLLETDRGGRQVSFLADEQSYRFVRSLQLRDLVVPVVGDFAGPDAVRAIGRDIARRGLVLAAFYTSNVEYYLMRDGGFDRFAANLSALPTDESSLIVRSLFAATSPVRHPQHIRGYPSTQLLQSVNDLLASLERGEIRSYGQLVTVGAIDPVRRRGPD